MLSRKTEANLLAMAKAPSFHTVSRGDTVYGVAEGFRKRKLMYQGATTPAGSHMRSIGAHLPDDGIDRTKRTVWRGNSEYSYTQSGREVRLRTADGSLTARGLSLIHI